jgi:hypothetical protein
MWLSRETSQPFQKQVWRQPDPCPVAGPCSSLKAPAGLLTSEATAALNVDSGPLKNADEQLLPANGCPGIPCPLNPP